MGKRTLIPFLLLLSDGGGVALDGYLDLIDSDLASLAIIGFTIVYGLYVNETALGFDRAGGNRQVWLSTCDTLVAVSNAYYNGGDVTVGNPCGGVGIEETETVAPMLFVSPNPATARVALGGLTPGQRVRVYDIKGRE